MDNIAHSIKNSSKYPVDSEEITNFLTLIHQKDDRFEIAALSPSNGGMISTICKLSNAATAFDALHKKCPDASGFYVGLNPTRKDVCIQPCKNRPAAGDIVKRTHLLVDIDSHKEGATPEERQKSRKAAVELAQNIAKDLSGQNWPEPVIVFTGNGAQAWYKIDEPTESTVIKRTLEALAEKYDTEDLRIDTSVHDAPRLARLPGTWNRKTKYPAAEWQKARIESAPVSGTMDAVPSSLLVNMAGAGEKSSFDWGDMKTVPGVEIDSEENRELFRAYLAKREGGVEHIDGHNNLLETARFGGDFGLSPEGIVEELTTAEDENGKTYNDRCKPHWDTEEMATVVRSSFNNRKEPVGCKTEKGLELQRAGYVEMFNDGTVQTVSTSKETPSQEESLYDRLKKRLHGEDFFLNYKNTELDYWVEGCLPAENYLVDLYGKAGCGKSTLAYQLCICVLNGVDFLGHKTHPMTKSGKKFNPLIISCEETERAYIHRMKIQREVLCGENGKLPFVLDLLGEETSFFTSGSKGGQLTELPRVIDHIIKEYGFNFVVIDNRAEVFHSDENNREEVSRFCGTLKKLCINSEVQILMLSHTNKSGFESGSTAWSGSGRVQIKIAQGKNDETELETTKANDIACGKWESVRRMPDKDKPGETLPVYIPANVEFDNAEQLEGIVAEIKEIVGGTMPEGISRQELKDDLHKALMDKGPFAGTYDGTQSKLTGWIKEAEERGIIVEKKNRGVRRLRLVEN